MDIGKTLLKSIQRGGKKLANALTMPIKNIFRKGKKAVNPDSIVNAVVNDVKKTPNF